MIRGMTNRRSVRRGYAMVTVLIALALMLSMISVGQRHLASVVRVTQAGVQARMRDEGRIQALARCLELLQTGLPPSARYRCATVVETSDGPISFTVTFTEEGGNRWSVLARPTRPGEHPEPMPTTFAGP